MAGIRIERGNSLLHNLMRQGSALRVIMGLSAGKHSARHRFVRLWEEKQSQKRPNMIHTYMYVYIVLHRLFFVTITIVQ